MHASLEMSPSQMIFDTFFQGDVIVSFDGVHVGCEGTVPFRSSEHIAFCYLISQK